MRSLQGLLTHENSQSHSHSRSQTLAMLCIPPSPSSMYAHAYTHSHSPSQPTSPLSFSLTPSPSLSPTPSNGNGVPFQLTLPKSPPSVSSVSSISSGSSLSFAFGASAVEPNALEIGTDTSRSKYKFKKRIGENDEERKERLRRKHLDYVHRHRAQVLEVLRKKNLLQGKSYSLNFETDDPFATLSEDEYVDLMTQIELEIQNEIQQQAAAAAVSMDALMTIHEEDDLDPAIVEEYEQYQEYINQLEPMQND